MRSASRPVNVGVITKLRHHTGGIVLAMVCSAQTFAQSTGANGASSGSSLDPIIVTGARASLATAQGIKRNQAAIVDAVVADDINKLPDFSVTEALQRVTGVQISRDRGEGGVVTIRGLTQMETTLNGREIFTAGWGRNLDFNDIPAEMVSSVNVFKTSSAEQIEGGVGGSIDLRTRRPFDFSGPQAVATVRTIHGSLVGDSKSQYSMLLSNRWTTGKEGKFGILLSLSRQERAWREDQKTAGAPLLRTDLVPGRTVLAPNGTTETASLGARKRTGGSLFLQWQPSDALELYAEGNHAEFRTLQNSYQVYATAPGAGAFVPGSVALFPGTADVQNVTWTNASISTAGAARDTIDRTTQVAVGGSWTRAALTLKTDLSYTKSHNNLFYSALTLNGTAATLTQNLAGSVPGSRVGGTNLLNLGSFATAGMSYASRPFDGDLKTVRLDGEYQMAGDFIDSLVAGVRYAKRHATDTPGQIVFYPAAVPAANAAGLVMVNPVGDFFPGATSIQGFLTGNPSVARNVDALRTALGIAATIPVSNPLGIWDIAEETQSALLMAKIKAATLPLDGNIGLRIVRTRETVTGNQTDPATGGIAPIAIDHAYTDTLPSINLRYQLAPGLYLRGAASKTLTRPDFNQLSPSLTLNPALLIGTAGNPALHPIRADNWDVAIERYIDKTTSVHLTGFVKKVDGFVTTATRPETYNALTYQVSRPQNANTADIKGLEIGYQQFYDFLPDWLRGLGLQANYTYVSSETLDNALGQKMPLQNLSKHSINLIGMLEKGPISARIAYNWRDKFLSGVTTVAGLGALPVYTKAYGWLDASLSYRVSDKISLTLEGLNLLRTRRSSYYGVETRPQSSWINDTQIAASLTVRF